MGSDRYTDESETDLDPQETEIEWRTNRVNAATFVALQLRDSSSWFESDYETHFGGLVAISLSSPIAIILYRRALFGALWILAVPAVAWFLFFLSGIWLRGRLAVAQEMAAKSLEVLAAEISDDREKTDG